MNSEPIDFTQKYKWKLQPQLMKVGVIPPSSDMKMIVIGFLPPCDNHYYTKYNSN